MKQQLLTSGKIDVRTKKYGLYNKVELSNYEYNHLENEVVNLEGIIEKLDLEKAMGKEYDISDYDLILKLSDENGKI